MAVLAVSLICLWAEVPATGAAQEFYYMCAKPATELYGIVTAPPEPAKLAKAFEFVRAGLQCVEKAWRAAHRSNDYQEFLAALYVHRGYEALVWYYLACCWAKQGNQDMAFQFWQVSSLLWKQAQDIYQPTGQQ